MFDFLDKLRTMPSGIRRRVAGLSAVIITAVLFVLWLGFGPLGPAGKASLAEEKDTPGPFSALAESVSSVWGKMVGQVLEVKNQFGGLKKEFIELASTTVATSSPATAPSEEKSGGIIIRDSFSTSSLKAAPY